MSVLTTNMPTTADNTEQKNENVNSTLMETVERKNKENREKEKKPIRQVVGAVVIDTENKRVMMVSSRKFENVFRLPKGICEDDESHEEAIIRVLHDEAGVKVDKLNNRIGTYTEANKRGKIVAHHWMYEVVNPTLMDTWPALDRKREWFTIQDAIGYSTERHISRLALNNSSLAKS